MKFTSENCHQPDHRWLTHLQKMIRRVFEKKHSPLIWKKYQHVFLANYQNLMPPRYAVCDIHAIEKTLTLNQAQVALLNPGKGKDYYRLHFYSLEQRFLDEYFPVLGNLSLRVIDQIQFPLQINGRQIFIKSFSIAASESQCVSFSELRCQLLSMIQAVMQGKVENDPLNSLLILTGLNWQEIDVLRAYRNYFLQLIQKATLDSFHQAVIGNPKVTQSLFSYFEARFRPSSKWKDNSQREEHALFPLRIKLIEDIESVVDINHDRILRSLFNLIDATVRCNFYLRKDTDDYFIAFKINSLGIIDMPKPRPVKEIYIHHVNMEAVHLRGGEISRGGIRWSDRIDDFRTEILGLMQTQMSKNVLIIPKGAKGGFIVKKQCEDACFRAAGKEAYKRLIKGLLDLTDNYIQDKIIQRPDIVSYDDCDPYLVVAADKGTAQFSDLANAIASEYNFWLADAFASGGSKGYNHKALGITARGAWESVKRHFRELDKNIQQQPFTVIGIGSMDGDVFGNGMLLSPAIRLLAAISGEHIFIDPDPNDLQACFFERKRLFDLAGSNWNDYNRQLISDGGGVYRRDAKAISISPILKKWLGIRYRTVDGEALIGYLLKAPVELLWLGGIGTYVKASIENQAAADDRENDSVRVDAIELKAKVVGEGANLGFTQKARIEYSLAGGRINTDAIDNSAGVDISDHEVNLKILLNKLYENQKIDDYSNLFNKLTQQICHFVLQNNYKQTLALSLEQLRGGTQTTAFLQLADQLETFGFLDRKQEGFPLSKTVLSRPKQRLTRPELAVLMAASKMYLTQQILEQTGFLEHDYFNIFLLNYFPEQISENYRKEVLSHPLAREIKATRISNTIINQAGCLFIQIQQGYEQDLIANCLCYLTFDFVLQADILRSRIFGLDNKIKTEDQYQALLSIEKKLQSYCKWAAINRKNIVPSTDTISCYQQYLDEYQHLYNQKLQIKETEYQYIEQFRQAGFPFEIAEQISFINHIEDFPYLVSLTDALNCSFSETLAQFKQINKLLGLTEVYSRIQNIPLENYWDQKIGLELRYNLTQITGNILNNTKQMQVTLNDYFYQTKKSELKQYHSIIQKIKVLPTPDIVPFIVLKDALEKLL